MRIPPPTLRFAERTLSNPSGATNSDSGDVYIGLDRFNRTIDQRWTNTAGTTDVDRFQYAYDYDSNPLYKKNTLSAAHSELYHDNGATNGYDGLNRLVSFSRGTLTDTNSDGIFDTISSPVQTIGYTLDTLGNWSSLNVNGTSTSRTHDAQNKLKAIGSSTLSYDAGGYQKVDENGHALSYDAWGHLMSFSASSTNTVSYTYDGMGRRIARIDKTGSTTNKASYFTYTANWQVATETSPQSSTTELDYVWSPVYVDAMVARDTYTVRNTQQQQQSSGGSRGLAGIVILPDGTYLTQRVYVRQDANWNTTSVAVGSMNPSNGNVTVISGSTLSSERYEYQPYGAVTFMSDNFTMHMTNVSTASISWQYLSQGGRQDEKSGLLAFRNRDRNTDQGRWVQPDPAKYADGANSYLALTDKPEAALDPLGLYIVIGSDQPSGQAAPDLSGYIPLGDLSAAQQASGPTYTPRDKDWKGWYRDNKDLGRDPNGKNGCPSGDCPCLHKAFEDNFVAYLARTADRRFYINPEPNHDADIAKAAQRMADAAARIAKECGGGGPLPCPQPAPPVPVPPIILPSPTPPGFTFRGPKVTTSCIQCHAAPGGPSYNGTAPWFRGSHFY